MDDWGSAVVKILHAAAYVQSDLDFEIERQSGVLGRNKEYVIKASRFHQLHDEGNFHRLLRYHRNAIKVQDIGMMEN